MSGAAFAGIIGAALTPSKAEDYGQRFVFTESGYFDVPENVWGINFALIGCGGGGGSALSYSQYCFGGGGGGGGATCTNIVDIRTNGGSLVPVFQHQLPVYPGERLLFSIGIPGSGGQNGGDGTPGSGCILTGHLFGTIQVDGGGGGQGANDANPYGAPGYNPNPSIDPPSPSNNSNCYGFPSHQYCITGSSYTGPDPLPPPPQNYGCGGDGGWAFNNGETNPGGFVTMPGRDGAPGIIIIWTSYSVDPISTERWLGTSNSPQPPPYNPP